MNEFITAFLWTLLLMLLIGVFLLGMEWLVLDMIHTPKLVNFGVEALTLIPLIALFVILFKSAYETEKEISGQVKE